LSLLSKITRNENFKSILAILVIIIVVLGFFFGLQFALNTEVPVRVVESGSMCLIYDGACDGWSHTFNQTLHVGDIIVIQGVDPETLNVDYPNSDIIVYLKPLNPTDTPIVHRIVSRYEVNGTLYFQTKGDGNGQPWPTRVSASDYDSNTLPGFSRGEGVSEDLVIGKVVMRIPWFGHITLFLRNNPVGLPIVIALIIILLLVEFVIPALKKKTRQTSQPSEEIKKENFEF
jgi:signal peptidase I